jgi:transcriptional regulator with XRE-family HTH domain
MIRPPDRRVPNDIRYYRQRANMRLYELAHYVGVSSSADVAHWEKGRKVPSLDTLFKLAGALNVPPQVLFLDRWKKMQAFVNDRRSLPIKKPL